VNVEGELFFSDIIPRNRLSGNVEIRHGNSNGIFSASQNEVFEYIGMNGVEGSRKTKTRTKVVKIIFPILNRGARDEPTDICMKFLGAIKSRIFVAKVMSFIKYYAVPFDLMDHRNSRMVGLIYKLKRNGDVGVGCNDNDGFTECIKSNILLVRTMKY